MALQPFPQDSLLEQYQYFSDITEDFSIPEALTKALREYPKEDFYLLSKFAIEELTDMQFGEGSNVMFESFFSSYADMYEEILSNEQQREVTLLYAMRCGTYEGIDPEVLPNFKLAIAHFLGDARQIDEVSSIEKAMDVAYTLFGGPRNLPESSYSKHLTRLVQVGKEGDVNLIQLVMRKLREAQLAEFEKTGYSLRLKFPAKDVIVMDEEEETVSVIIPFGSRAFAALKSGDMPTIGFNGGPSGAIPVFPSGEKTDEELRQEAIKGAGQHFDDPILLTGNIAPSHIKNGYISFHEDIKDFSQSEVSLGAVAFLDREDLEALYPDAAPSLLQRLDKLLYREVIAPQPPQPELVAGYSDTTKKIARASVAFVAGLLFYKYVGKSLYLKGKEWWYAKPKPAIKTH